MHVLCSIIGLGDVNADFAQLGAGQFEVSSTLFAGASIAFLIGFLQTDSAPEYLSVVCADMKEIMLCISFCFGIFSCVEPGGGNVCESSSSLLTDSAGTENAPGCVGLCPNDDTASLSLLSTYSLEDELHLLSKFS